MQLDQLESHHDLLARWNQKLNLIRVPDLKELVQLHYCESLFLATLLPKGSIRVADVGSGAGFPGIPVAVFRPECRVDLIESDQRKGVFLREATRSIPNALVIGERAESLKPGSYDWLVTRAVSPAAVLDLRLAPDFMLLGSLGRANSTAGVEWREPIKVPWGRSRYVLAGSLHVPRGTPDVLRSTST